MSENEIQILKEKYINSVKAECKRIIKQSNLKILKFLFKNIFDEQYYQLTKLYHYNEQLLNYEIVTLILYPDECNIYRNTNDAIVIIPAFVLFYMGQNLELHQFINITKEDNWNNFLTGVAYKINGEIDQSIKYFEKFQKILEITTEQYLAVDFDASIKAIQNYLNPKQILKLLNLIFYQDYFIFMIQLDEQNGYLNFLADKKREMIQNIFNCIDKKYSQLNTFQDYQKMQVAISFLQNDYTYNFIKDDFNNLKAGMVIYTLIQLDRMQFQNYFASFSLGQFKVQQEYLEQILHISNINFEEHFFRLLLVAKSLTKLLYWEDAQKIWKILAKQKNQTRYSIYINFKIYKIQYLQGNFDIKKIIDLINQMEVTKKKKLDYFQFKNNIYYQCIFFAFLICIYHNKIDKIKFLEIKISNILFINDEKNKKRSFSILQQKVFNLIKYHGQLFQKEKNGSSQFNTILKTIQKICEQRQRITQNYKIIAEFFNLLDSQQLNQQFYIKSYYKCVEQILCINLLIRFKELSELQYLNSSFHNIFLIIANINEFYGQEKLARINFFLHNFEKAFTIGKKIKDHYLIGQIYEYNNQNEQASIEYDQTLDRISQFNKAIINRTSDQAFDNFKALEQNSYHLKWVCEMFRQDTQRQQTYKAHRNSFSNNYQSEDKKQLPLFKNGSDNQNFIEINSQQIQSLEDSQLQNNQQVEDEDEDEQVKLLCNQFKFKLRDDVLLFYYSLCFDLDLQSNDQEEKKCLKQTLDKFVQNTENFTIESDELFQDGFTNQLGRGGQAEVYKFEYKNKYYAAKELKFSYKTNQQCLKEQIQNIDQLLFEPNILNDIKKKGIPHTLQLQHIGFKFYNSKEFYVKSYVVVLVSEIYQEFSILRNWSLNDKLIFIEKLAWTLYMLQEQMKLLHLDLKPQNILVNEYQKEPILIDFGLSKNFFGSITFDGATLCTPRYVCPQFYTSNFVSRKNDVYSYGLTIYQFITNQFPYPEDNDCYFIPNIEFIKVPQHIENIQQIQDEFIQQLIIDCTKYIDERITFANVCYKFFFNNKHQQLNQTLKQLILLASFDDQRISEYFIDKFQELDQLKNQPYYQTDEITFNYNLKDNLFKQKIQSKLIEISSWILVNKISQVLKLIDIKLEIQNQNCNIIFVIQKASQLTNCENEPPEQLKSILKEINDLGIQLNSLKPLFKDEFGCLKIGNFDKCYNANLFEQSVKLQDVKTLWEMDTKQYNINEYQLI